MNDNRPEEFSLLESLNQERLLLPLACVRECGPAAQTLAGIRRVTNRETYVATKTIAKESRVRIRTVRRHITTLADHGWIENGGREKTRSGRARRTNTIRLGPRCRVEWKPYGILPWWANGFDIARIGKLPWSSKVILSVVLGRLAALKSAVNEQTDLAVEDEEELIDVIEEYGGADRFRWSLRRLERETGLTRPSIVAAKRWLHDRGLIEWSGDDRGETIDTLCPNWEFRVQVKPAGGGKVYLSFRKGG